MSQRKETTHNDYIEQNIDDSELRSEPTGETGTDPQGEHAPLSEEFAGLSTSETQRAIDKAAVRAAEAIIAQLHQEDIS